MYKWAIGIVCWLLLSAGYSAAQADYLAAVIQVIGEEIYFQRAHTQTELPLPVGVRAPFGIDDRIRTGTNGRILISLTADHTILLLPNSEFTIMDFERRDTDSVQLRARLRGIAVHNFAGSLQYQLDTESFSITGAAGNFAVWGGGLQAVTSAIGQVRMEMEGDHQEVVSGGTGYALPFSQQPVELAPPLHAAQVVEKSTDCVGTVVTSDSQELRLRAGASLDYIIVAALQSGQQVRIAGVTENGLWYRIPFQTGFGWTYSRFVTADCQNLPRFPNLFGELPESIQGTTQAELRMLEPFYGTPLTNSVFYR